MKAGALLGSKEELAIQYLSEPIKSAVEADGDESEVALGVPLKSHGEADRVAVDRGDRSPRVANVRRGRHREVTVTGVQHNSVAFLGDVADVGAVAIYPYRLADCRGSPFPGEHHPVGKHVERND